MQRLSTGSVARAIALFLGQTLLCLLVTAGIAAIWAAANHGVGFVSAFHVGLYVFGCVTLGLGAFGVGGMSPSQGFVNFDFTAGRLPGVPTKMRVSPDGTAVNGTAILLLTGIALIAIGMVT
jgi:hypothetical protein